MDENTVSTADETPENTSSNLLYQETMEKAVEEAVAEPMPVDSTVNVVNMAEKLLPAKGKAKSRAGITKKNSKTHASKKKAYKLEKKMRKMNHDRNSSGRN